MEEPSQRRSAFFMTLALALFGGAGVFVAYSNSASSKAGGGGTTEVLMGKSLSSKPTLLVLTDYELADGGRSIASDYTFGIIAQTNKVNYMSLASGEAVSWKVNGVDICSEATTSCDFDFPNVTNYTVTVDDTFDFTVHSKIVRRELRDLTTTDRESYFSAMLEMYEISQSEGESKYGEHFQNADTLLAHHLAGAADKECDHWHDDAGMINHHVGITWKFEQSLRMIDPTTASHYWDYTRDTDDEWYQSSIFTDDYFGPSSPSNEKHIVDSGYFSYLKVMTKAREFSLVSNPYGMLRSPWNTNPTPYLLRSNITAGVFADGYTEFPTCSAFVSAIGDSLGEIVFFLNGELHGPIHIMVGGHWNLDHRLEKAANSYLSWGADLFLLLSKFLWRQGIVRLPETCSFDSSEDCKAWCPTEILGDGISAEDFIERYGLVNVSSYIKPLVAKMKDDYSMTDKEIVSSLCEVGHPGEMFTSAAPQDPIFWPLHGNAERFVSLLRTWKASGLISFDETWDYYHVKDVPSDTHRICDWSGVEGLELPTCTAGICPGHKGTDLLPFSGLLSLEDTTTYTNEEFLELISPFNSEMPYVFDSLDKWESCTDGSIYAEYEESKKPGYAENHPPKGHRDTTVGFMG